jgi:hypothetical protein
MSGYRCQVNSFWEKQDLILMSWVFFNQAPLHLRSFFFHFYSYITLITLLTYLISSKY